MSEGHISFEAFQNAAMNMQAVVNAMNTALQDVKSGLAEVKNGIPSNMQSILELYDACSAISRRWEEQILSIRSAQEVVLKEMGTQAQSLGVSSVDLT